MTAMIEALVRAIDHIIVVQSVRQERPGLYWEIVDQGPWRLLFTGPEVEDGDTSLDDQSGLIFWELKRLKVVAAIEAMRKPTDEMVWAVCETNGEAANRQKCQCCPNVVATPYGDGTQACRLIAEGQIEALIDAALEEKP